MPRARAADVLADTMLDHGVDRAFAVPGESYLALLDALVDRPALDLVVARHEAGAGFMALADAKCTGRPGVCFVSRGPGATNAAIAVHSAQQDATPLMVLVGQVSRTDRGRGAFQEMDYGALFGHIAKGTWEVADAARLPETFARAWVAATSGTPGPAVVAVPEDVFEERVDVPPCQPQASPRLDAAERVVDEVAGALGRASRPILLAGGALDSPDGRDALRSAAARHRLPVVLSYKRQDLFDNADPLFGGYLGFRVPAPQVALLGQADLVLAVGTRLGEVTTQHYRLPAAPVPEQTLIHVYPDPNVLGRVFRTDLAVAADPCRLLARLAERAPTAASEERDRWTRSLHDHASALAVYHPASRPDGVEFGAVVHALAARAAPDAVVSTDGGNFGGWVHRVWPWTPASRLIGLAGGAMGMGVPGGVAAALRYRERQVIAFVGDGGFMMTGAELATAVQRRCDLMIVVANNRSYGTIRQLQAATYPGRRLGTALGAIDFAALARACGARGLAIRTLDEVQPAVSEALETRGPTVIDVKTSLEAISAYAEADA